jgi:hypothetical protein
MGRRKEARSDKPAGPGRKTVAHLIVGDVTIYLYDYAITLKDKRQRRLVTYWLNSGRVTQRADRGKGQAPSVLVANA